MSSPRGPRARAKSSDRRLTCADAAVERLRSGAEPVPSRRQTDRQVALTWAAVECSPCRWSALRRLRRPDSGRSLLSPQFRPPKADFAAALTEVLPCPVLSPIPPSSPSPRNRAVRVGSAGGQTTTPGRPSRPPCAGLLPAGGGGAALVDHGTRLAQLGADRDDAASKNLKVEKSPSSFTRSALAIWSENY